MFLGYSHFLSHTTYFLPFGFCEVKSTQTTSVTSLCFRRFATLLSATLRDLSTLWRHSSSISRPPPTKSLHEHKTQNLDAWNQTDAPVSTSTWILSDWQITISNISCLNRKLLANRTVRCHGQTLFLNQCQIWLSLTRYQRWMMIYNRLGQLVVSLERNDGDLILI